MTSSRTGVVLFARTPARDAVCKPLVRGAPRAVQESAHRLLWARTLAAVAAQDPDVSVLVVLDGDPTDLPGGAWRAGRPVRVVSQRGEGFAERLRNAFEDAATLGLERVVVIGTDTPGLGRATLRRAIAAPGAVCGPAPDGGVYLIGLDLGDAARLGEVPWQTARVAAALRACLPGASWLPALSDLDHPVSVRALRRILRREPAPAVPRDRALVDRRRLHDRLVHVDANAPPG